MYGNCYSQKQQQQGQHNTKSNVQMNSLAPVEMLFALGVKVLRLCVCGRFFFVSYSAAVISFNLLLQHGDCGVRSCDIYVYQHLADFFWCPTPLAKTAFLRGAQNF